MTPLRVIRFAIAVVYVGMAAWMIAAAVRRFILVAAGEQPADPAPYAALGIALTALGLLVAYAVVRRHEIRKRLR